MSATTARSGPTPVVAARRPAVLAVAGAATALELTFGVHRALMFCPRGWGHRRLGGPAALARHGKHAAAAASVSGASGTAAAAAAGRAAPRRRVSSSGQRAHAALAAARSGSATGLTGSGHGSSSGVTRTAERSGETSAAALVLPGIRSSGAAPPPPAKRQPQHPTHAGCRHCLTASQQQQQQLGSQLTAALPRGMAPSRRRCHPCLRACRHTALAAALHPRAR